MKLPIPIFSGGKTYTDAEVESPRAGVLADTRKAAEDGHWFAAVHTLISGCITQLSGDDDVTERARIRALCRHMPFRSAEYMSIQAILLISPDDGFEGVYVCPRCEHKIVTEYSEQDGEVVVDTRDFVSQLEITCMNGEGSANDVQLEDPIEIKSKGEIIEMIESFEMRFPTLADCMTAENRYGHKNTMRMQFCIYSEAIDKVNGQEVDAKWRNRFGILLFENIKNFRGDFRRIDRLMSRYGIRSEIEKTCPECGKEWNATVNTSSFFESALRSM